MKQNDSNVIILSDKTPFACGDNKHIYLNPCKNGRIIKVTHSKSLTVLKGKKRLLSYYLRSKNYWNPIYMEYYSHKNLIKNLIKNGYSDIYRHIPKYYGFVQTDMGGGWNVN